MFNVADAGELAGHLTRLLERPDRRGRWETGPSSTPAASRGRQRPRRPSRRSTARLALSRRPARGPRRRPAQRRIAFFSPLPPLSAAVADDSERLLKELGRRYTIDLYHDPIYLPFVGLRSPEFRCLDYRLFERNAAVLGYHGVIYRLGDSHHHGYMYDTLLRHPGIVMLHELSLAGFQVAYAHRPGVDSAAHIGAEFEAFCGPGAGEVLRAVADRVHMAGGWPAACLERGIDLNARVLRRAAAVVVHSPWCVEQVRSRFPELVGKMSVVPPGAAVVEPSAEDRRGVRARFDMPTEALIVASVGRIHPSRMNAETVAAFAPLAAVNPSALLVFAGKEDDHGEARRKALELGLRHRVRFLGHRTAGVAADLAAIADIGVCLRRTPTGGETPTATWTCSAWA